MSSFIDFFIVIILVIVFAVTIFLFKIFDIFLKVGYFIFKVTSLGIEVLLKASYFWKENLLHWISIDAM